MNSEQNQSRSHHVERLLDRSVAYEMIHDFGIGAFTQVVSQYQLNMTRKLAELENCASAEDLGKTLWGLQFIRNCSAQLGIVGVVVVCSGLADEVLKHGLSGYDHGQLEYALGSAVDALNRLSIN